MEDVQSASDRQSVPHRRIRQHVESQARRREEDPGAALVPQAFAIVRTCGQDRSTCSGHLSRGGRTRYADAGGEEGIGRGAGKASPGPC